MTHALTTIPHLNQFLGLWAIREEDFYAGHQWFLGLDLHVHLAQAPSQAARQAETASTPDIRNGVEVIGLAGTLMKQQSSMSRSGSTVLARRRVRAAVRNPDVAAILLHIESPGGTVAGTKELADDIAAAAKQKPVYAYIEDLGASAAYWIASQATKVFANETALVGSIGTYGVVQDFSARAAKEGIQVHVVRAGAFKGAGTPGTPVTPEQLAELQARIDSLNEFFIRGVAAGRQLSLAAVRALADGRVYVGAAAKENHLIDGVQSLDDTFTQLAKLGHSKRKAHMELQSTAEAAITPELAVAAPAAHVAASGTSAQQAQAGTAAAAAPAARPATLAEVRAACPGATNDFVVSQLEANATVTQAQAAFMAHITKQNAELTQKLNEKTVAAAAAPLKAPGVTAAVPAAAAAASSESAEDPLAAFAEAVATEMKAGKPRHEAHAAVCRKQPELREAMLAAHNSAHRQAARRR